MKIRTDFVTNSSSSSFVIAYRSEKEAIANACKAIYEIFNNEDDDWYSNDDLKHNLGQCVFDIMNKENHMTKDQVLKSYRDNIGYITKVRISDKLEEESKRTWQEQAQWEKEHAEEFNKMVEDEIDKGLKKIEKKIGSKKFIAELEYEDHYPEQNIFDAMKELPGLVTIFDWH